MSRLNAGDVQFEPEGQLEVYKGKYKDPYQNQWSIEVSGKPEIVREFIQQCPFDLYARPLSPKEAERIRSEMIKKAEGKQKESVSVKFPAEHPSLAIILSLVELAIKPPYLISSTVDPAPPFSQSYNLEGSNITARVSFWALFDTVTVSLSSPGLSSPPVTGVIGEAALPLPTGGRVDVKVSGSSDSRFSLGGDIVVLE